MTFQMADERPAGLSDGEAAIMLDGGQMVAVSVTSRWLENGAGVAFLASARWIEADGRTLSCPNGQPVRTEATHNADPHTVRVHGVDAIAKELLLAVLGEPQTILERAGEGGGFEAPMLMHGDQWRMNASIRHAIDAAAATAPRHAATLLFGEASQAAAPKTRRKTAK
jgi:hypothetical protein